MILLLDNYDSFVYNLARYVGRLGYERTVVRNDEITLDEITALNPTHIILSPGPCTPNEAGISLSLIRKFYQHIPLLGVCLGHQSIAQVFGGRVVRANNPMHGKASSILHNQQGVFAGIPNPFQAARYHSLIIDEKKFPQELSITARTEEGTIMAIQHHRYPVHGVQFHPESILTNDGLMIIDNFLQSKVS